jgi:hypothetical protein
MKHLTAAAAVLVSAMLLAGCGSDSTGPSQNPEGWNEYTIDGVTLEWMVNDTTSTLHVRVDAPTTGWVAAGFDPVTFMSEANLIIGYVDGSTVSIRDDWGTGAVTHEADTALGGTDDVTTVTGSETSTNTQIEFSIPLDSGDSYDKALVEGTTYTVILAYGPDGADDYTTQHEYATSISVEL